MWGVPNFLLTNPEGADPQVFCAMTLESGEGERSRGLLCLSRCWSPYSWFAAVYNVALKKFALPVLCCNSRIIQKLRKKINSFLALEVRKFKIRRPTSDKRFIVLHPVVGNGRQKQERSIPFQTDCLALTRACLPIPLLQGSGNLLEEDPGKSWKLVRSVVEHRLLYLARLTHAWTHRHRGYPQRAILEWLISLLGYQKGKRRQVLGGGLVEGVWGKEVKKEHVWIWSYFLWIHAWNAQE